MGKRKSPVKPPLPDDIVTKVRLRLMDDGRPQYVIAADIGVPASRMSDYALGRRTIPQKHVFRFCTVLNCNPEDLLGYAEPRDLEPYLATDSNGSS